MTVIVSPSSRRDLIAGATSGLVGGLVLSLVVQLQGTTAASAGPVGWESWGINLGLQLPSLILAGAAFGAIFGYHPESTAFHVSGGLLFGLLWWILGPLTLMRLWQGHVPAWSLHEASDAFPSLIGYLVYGTVMGMSFYALVSVHARRYPEESSGLPVPASPAIRVVVLGGGFGGVSAARHLEHLLARDREIEVTLVSQSNYLLFTPLLASVASSGLEAQHISAPLRAALPRTDVRRAEVEAIDTRAQVAWIRASPSAQAEALPYDHLVLALGSVPNYFELPGVKAHSCTLKTLEDATRLRDHVIALLERVDAESDVEERRRQLTFVVAGGGFAGTETIAEMLDLVRSILRYYPHIQESELRFILAHSGGRILPEISPALAEYALLKLQARGIEVLLNTRVVGATSAGVALSNGREVATRTVVWTAGSEPHPLLKVLACEHNRAGAVVCDSTLRVNGLANVWAVGDCAQIPDLYHGGEPCPPTAQHALRQGTVVAENVIAALNGTQGRLFRFQAIGVLVGLGHRTAVAEIRGWKFSGLLAWFMWRTVYLSKLPGLEKKLRVVLDWTIDLFFPRDIVLTASLARPASSQISSVAHEANEAQENRMGDGSRSRIV